MKKYQDILIILFLSLLGALFVLYATAPFGTGISGDSVIYLYGAKNILAGQGYTGYYGHPITLYPPFLSYFMVLLMRLFDITALSAGNIINALSFGATIFLSGLILKKVFKGKPAYYYFGTLTILISRPLFAITTTIATDTLFNVYVLLFFYFFYLYSKTKELKYLLIIGVISSFSVLIRYLGVLFIFSGVVMVFITEYSNWKKAIKNSIIYGLISSIGALYFVIFRNYLRFGTFTGNWAGEKDFLSNFEFSLNRIMGWFVPLSISKYIPVYILFFAIFIALGYFLNKYGWKKSLAQFNEPYLIFIGLCSSFYFFAVVTAAFTNDHIHYADDRYYLPIYFPLILFSLIFFERIVYKQLNKFGKMMVILFLTFFLLYHTEGIRSHIHKVREGNSRIYNIYNVPEIRDQEIYEIVDLLPEDYPIFTNYTDLLFMHTNKKSEPSFGGLQAEGLFTPSNDLLKEKLPEFKLDSPVYFVWFENIGINRNFFSPTQLNQYFDMDILNLSTLESTPMDANWETERNIISQIFIIYP